MTEILDVKIGAFVAPRKDNPFDGVVAQVLDPAIVLEDGAIPSGTVTIPAETALSTAQAKLREAARDAGVKARIRNVDEVAREITFTLHDRKTSVAKAEDEAPKDAKKG